MPPILLYDLGLINLVSSPVLKKKKQVERHAELGREYSYCFILVVEKDGLVDVAIEWQIGIQLRLI